MLCYNYEFSPLLGAVVTAWLQLLFSFVLSKKKILRFKEVTTWFEEALHFYLFSGPPCRTLANDAAVLSIVNLNL